MLSIARIFTVSKNETDLIEDFIIYHGKIFGFENVIIIDNGSTCKIVLDIYSKYIKKGLIVETELGYDGFSQGKHFTKYMKKYSLNCEFLIGLDTDEFIYNESIINTLKSLPKKYTKFIVKKYMASFPDKSDSKYIEYKVDRPASNITTFIKEEAKPQKCFFRSKSFISTVNGCHNGKVIKGDTTYTNDIEYYHFHSTGKKRSIERSKCIIDGYKYTNINYPIFQQLKDLINIKPNSPGIHRVFEYGIFLNKLLTLTLLKENGLWPQSNKSLEKISLGFPIFNGWNINTLQNHATLINEKKSEKDFNDLIYFDKEITKDVLISSKISEIIHD